MTGYVAQLLEKNLSFQQWAMVCARAFGAFIDLRDEPIDAPSPTELKPSAHYQQRLEETRSELSRLKAMSNAERIAFGKAQKTKALASLREAASERSQQNARLLAERKTVSAWEPPTPDHEDLKKFMLEQLHMCIENDDWYTKQISQIEARSPGSFYAERVITAEKNIEYYTAENAKEIERVASRNKWIRDLRESLNGTPITA